MNPRRLPSLAIIASIWAIAGTLVLSAQNISLTVDATKTQNKILHAHLVIPVKPGPLTLYYPKWIPGEHGPDGPIADLTGLKFEGNGKVIPWQRDLLDTSPFTSIFLKVSPALTPTTIASSPTARRPPTS